VVFSFVGHYEAYVFAVHRDKSARLTYFAHLGVLLEAVKKEIKQIVDLTELNELLEVF